MVKIDPARKNDRELISRAFEFAKKHHEGQLRAGGEPYIVHPVAVAQTLAELKLDSATIAAGLLHDTVEDTPATEEDIEKNFGKEVAFLVKGATKLSRIQYQDQSLPEAENKKNLYAQNLRKMFFAMADDIRVILIKLADRYHNMDTITAKAPEDRKRISLETLEIYGPIAERLGMGHIKGELEDMAFPHAYPEEHRWLMKIIKDKYPDRKKYLEKIQPLVVEKLESGGIKIIDAHSRAKHYYSLYKKLLKNDQDLGRVHDLVALRIILPDISSCYEAMGIIHKYYKPVPRLIKDYIALPKLNGYQSIHTTIFGEKGRFLEIQLRTPQMHEHAENGIAAHWSYGETGKNKLHIANVREAQWISKLKKWVEESDNQELYQSLKTNFFSDRVFVFTPKGEVKELPEGSTPVDFAYSIHTDMGHLVKGAKVNGKLVSLDYQLKNGDMVEIMKGKKARPSRDWLSVVKTGEAKKKIQSWLKENDTTFEQKTKERIYRPTDILITVKDKIGMLHEIGKIMKDLKINILEIKNTPPLNGVAKITLTLALKEKSRLEKIIKKIKSNKNVLGVR